MVQGWMLDVVLYSHKNHPGFMGFSDFPGVSESLGVESHACPRLIGTWIGPAVEVCFWVRVAESEIETGFTSRSGGSLIGDCRECG